MAPESAKPPPTKNEERARGNLRCRRMVWSLGDKARMEIFTGPVLRARNKETKRKKKRISQLQKNRRMGRLQRSPDPYFL